MIKRQYQQSHDILFARIFARVYHWTHVGTLNSYVYSFVSATGNGKNLIWFYLIRRANEWITVSTLALSVDRLKTSVQFAAIQIFRFRHAHDFFFSYSRGHVCDGKVAHFYSFSLRPYFVMGLFDLIFYFTHTIISHHFLFNFRWFTMYQRRHSHHKIYDQHKTARNRHLVNCWEVLVTWVIFEIVR